MIIRFILTFLTFLFLNFTSHATQTQLSSDSETIQKITIKNFEYVKDTSANNSLSLSAISNWQKTNKTKFGLQPHPYWFKCTYTSDTKEQRLFVLDYPLTDSITLYHYANNSLQLKKESGDAYPFYKKEIPDTGNVFKIHLLKGVNTFYVRINSTSSINFHPKLYTTNQFYQEKTQSNLCSGLFYGWLLVMVFYNLFLFFRTKDINYFWMCLLALSNIFLFLAISGLGYQFIWTDAIVFNQNSFIVFGSLFTLITIAFSYSFLEINKRSSFLKKYYIILFIITLCFLLGSFLTSYDKLVKPLMLFIFHNSFFFPISAFVIYRSGHQKAKYFLLAQTIYLSGSLLAITQGLDLNLPSWIKGFDALQLSSAVEVLFYSLALADSINRLKEEVLQKEIEKTQLEVQLTHQLNIELEKTVEIRTKELKEANLVKDKFFAIIAHDLRSSVTSFKGVGRMINSYLDKDNIDRAKNISIKIDNASERLGSFLDNLLKWSFTQLNNVPYHPTNVNIHKVCSQEIGYRQSLLDEKNIQINIAGDTELTCFADPNGTGLIIGNVISNAIKFSHTNTTIHIQWKANLDNVCILITDKGVGMTNNQLKKLFTLQQNKSELGTQGETGSGLGLLLCKEFAELNKGKLSIESAPNKGTTISIYLPKKEN